MVLALSLLVVAAAAAKESTVLLQAAWPQQPARHHRLSVTTDGKLVNSEGAEVLSGAAVRVHDVDRLSVGEEEQVEHMTDPIFVSTVNGTFVVDKPIEDRLPLGDAPEFSTFLKRQTKMSSQTTSRSSPRVYFLVMAGNKIHHFDVWERFFASAEEDKYRVLLHCVDAEECEKLYGDNPRYTQIETVWSYFCGHLVEPMNALVAAALTDETSHANDKFVFLSDRTLPVKPFGTVYDKLSKDANSDFCTYPTRGWDDDSQGHFNIKTHQWSVLSLAHAQRAVEMLDDKVPEAFNANGMGSCRCPDECWHFYEVFGLMKTGMQRLDLQGFNGGPLLRSSENNQGQCDTYSSWPSTRNQDDNISRTQLLLNNVSKTSNRLSLIESSLPVDELPRALTDESQSYVALRMYHPGNFDLNMPLHEGHIRIFRDSPFLFARKFSNSVNYTGDGELAEDWERLIFKP